MARARCPHADIRFCPLYVAAHGISEMGCDDGHLDSGECAVSRKLNYASAVARLAVDPEGFEVVARCEAAERMEQARQQRARNLRAAGIH